MNRLIIIALIPFLLHAGDVDVGKSNVNVKKPRYIEKAPRFECFCDVDMLAIGGSPDVHIDVSDVNEIGAPISRSVAPGRIVRHSPPTRILPPHEAILVGSPQVIKNALLTKAQRELKQQSILGVSFKKISGDLFLKVRSEFNEMVTYITSGKSQLVHDKIHDLRRPACKHNKDLRANKIRLYKALLRMQESKALIALANANTKTEISQAIAFINHCIKFGSIEDQQVDYIQALHDRVLVRISGGEGIAPIRTRETPQELCFIDSGSGQGQTLLCPIKKQVPDSSLGLEASSAQSQLASDFLETEFGIAKDRYLNFTGTTDQLKNHAVIQQAINNQVSYLHQAKTIEEQGIWAVALQSNVAAFKDNESGDLQEIALSTQSIDQSELVDFATQIVSRIGDNAQHPISFIREKIENVVDIGCAIADLTIGQAFRTPEQQVQRIQEFVESIHSFTSLPWAERKKIFAKTVADVVTVGGFASAANAVRSLATSIPRYLPEITAAFSEGASELLGALSETLSGASFSGGAASAEVVASQEVIAESIAQVAGTFAVAIAADGTAALSMPDPTAALRQDNEKVTGGSGPDVVKSQPTKTVDDLIKEATPKSRQTDGPAKQYEKQGKHSDAVRDFHSLNPQNIKDVSHEQDGSKLIGWLKDGRQIMVRKTSSKGPDYPKGGPTLQVTFTRNNILKIRYL